MIFCLLFAGLLAAGCVTVDDKPKVKVQEAVTSRVAAGLEYLQQGNPAEARRHFSRALELDDDSPVAHNAMALLYKYEMDPDREEYHYKKALDADSHFAPALNNYGTLLYSRGDYQKALELFERAANDPNYEGRGSAWGNMGRCYLKLGESDRARNAFIKELRLNPRAVEPNLDLAELYYQDKRTKLAWDYYQQYLQRSGRQSAEALWLGIRLASELHYADQQSSYELALENLYRNSEEYRKWQEWKAAKESRS
ncbi:type IV pili biogenesis protein PilF [Alcanivorax hongdengensis A-11-3]|uniref:Type IV pili biogenesis protein PilF n=1 Tax=Alcanivorax hongdengensis A-11-3 TaxID=1177179 RepID=L0WFP8_9GAMM|nr:type IV pili biogenesis protein PilF [Alcanivorax hongdengensis A-11-3]